MIDRVVESLLPMRGQTGRSVVAVAMLILGCGRLGIVSAAMVAMGFERYGVLTVGSPTALPARMYGLLFTALAIGLWLTGRERRCTPLGRLMAAFSAGACAGLGVDVGPLNTSAIMLYWFTICMVAEAGVRDDC